MIIIEQGARTEMSVRVATSGGLAAVRGFVGAGQARPPFLDQLARTCRVMYEGMAVEPEVLEEEAIDAFVREELCSETRGHPIAVLAPQEDGSYVMPPEEIANELLGVAHVRLLQRHQATFRLTDSIGDRRLSAYWGALRLYQPGFSCADDGSTHPLLFADRLIDPVMRAELVGRLAQQAARRTQMPAGVAERRARPAAATATATAATSAVAPAATLSQTVGSDAAIPQRREDDLAPLVRSLGEHLRSLATQVSELVGSHERLLDELARLRTTSAVRAGNTASLERRIGSLESLLRSHLSPSAPPDGSAATAEAPDVTEAVADDDESGRLTLPSVLRQAAETYPAELLVRSVISASSIAAASRAPRPGGTCSSTSCAITQGVSMSVPNTSCLA